MHPIERLRYVARASGAEPHALTQEVAGSLARFAGDPAALVTACRRMVDRHPAIGPIWWLCARVLTAGDPADEAWRALDDLHADRPSPSWPTRCPRTPRSASSAGRSGSARP